MSATTADMTRTRAWRPDPIIARELRVSLPVVAGVLFLQSLTPLIIHTSHLMLGSRSSIGMVKLIELCMAGGIVITAMMLGVLCGGEEEENGTINFLLRLPVRPAPVFARKLSGSLAAFAVYLAASHILAGLLADVYGGEAPPVTKDQWIAPKTWQQLTYAFHFYAASVAAGVWLRQVIPAAVTAGLGAALLSWAIGTLSDRLPDESMAARDTLFGVLLVLAGVGLLTFAAAGFVRREGR